VLGNKKTEGTKQNSYIQLKLLMREEVVDIALYCI